jgi:hypothetical protein
MNVSLPSAAGVQTASGLIESAASRGGAAARDPSAAVIAGNRSETISARGRGTGAALPIRAPLSLCTGLCAEVGLTGSGCAAAFGCSGRAASLGGAKRLTQRRACGRGAFAAGHGRDVAITTCAACTTCTTGVSRSTDRGRRPCRVGCATDRCAAHGRRVTANGSLACDVHGRAACRHAAHRAAGGARRARCLRAARGAAGRCLAATVSRVGTALASH